MPGNVIKTGIEGFDRLVGGGFRPGKNILISGTPGTGKTIFALQYLYNGARDFGDNGLYISFEENTRDLKSQAVQFGWNLEELEKKGKISVINIPVKEIKENTAADILRMVKKNKIKRLVIDSLSAMSINTPTTYAKVTDMNEFAIRRFMYHFINDLRDLNETTTLLISQTTDGELSRDSVSEFVCDGILLIKYEPMGGKYSRSLHVRKMREVNNDEDLHPLEISSKGIVVHSFKE